MKIYKIHPEQYTAIQRAVDDYYYESRIKKGRCKHIFPPEMEPEEDGYIYLRVKQWLLELDGMVDLLKDLEEITLMNF